MGSSSPGNTCANWAGKGLQGTGANSCGAGQQDGALCLAACGAMCTASL